MYGVITKKLGWITKWSGFKGSGFIFESVDLLSYSLHKIILKRVQSYIKSSEWVINIRATINPKNKDNKCFQDSITVALNHQNIDNHPEKISNIKPLINITGKT